MLKVRDIMTTDVVTLSPDDTLRFAADLLAHEHMSGAPVVSDGGVVGVLSTTDLLTFVASHPVSLPEDAASSVPALMPAEWDALDEHTVDEVMSRNVWALTPDADITVAASLMVQAGIHRVIIAEGDKLAGIVTTSDITGVVAP